ncbi:hypothetical protein B0H14DRAFT_3641512 [Mycena olivaceomarginata]|nr:hypothetical protein B0H14DRAFT_3641512 [Mycena olivaceomarginata]
MPWRLDIWLWRNSQIIVYLDSTRLDSSRSINPIFLTNATLSRSNRAWRDIRGRPAGGAIGRCNTVRLRERQIGAARIELGAHGDELRKHESALRVDAGVERQEQRIIDEEFELDARAGIAGGDGVLYCPAVSYYKVVAGAVTQPSRPQPPFRGTKRVGNILWQLETLYYRHWGYLPCHKGRKRTNRRKYGHNDRKNTVKPALPSRKRPRTSLYGYGYGWVAHRQADPVPTPQNAVTISKVFAGVVNT